jgi:hypothetical protein
MKMFNDDIKKLNIHVKFWTKTGASIDFLSRSGKGIKHKEREITVEDGFTSSIKELARMACMFNFEKETIEIFNNEVKKYKEHF